MVVNDRRFVFLVGTPRSGTTWLQLLLAQHPDVATCRETHLFASYLGPMSRTWHRRSQRWQSAGLHAAITKSEFVELQRQFALDVLNRIGGDQFIVLEKTPAHLRWLDVIQETLPEARFIHLIRDPRAVAASLAAASRDWAADWASASALQNAEMWVDSVSRGLAFGRSDPSMFIEVRYEDLLTDPLGCIERIFGSMGLATDDASLWNRVEAHVGIDKLRTGQTEVAWAATGLPAGVFRRGEPDAWRDELSGREVAIVEQVAGDLMAELGYERAASGWAPPLVAVARWRDRFEAGTRRARRSRRSTVAGFGQ